MIQKLVLAIFLVSIVISTWAAPYREEFQQSESFEEGASTRYTRSKVGSRSGSGEGSGSGVDNCSTELTNDEAIALRDETVAALHELSATTQRVHVWTASGPVRN